MKITYYVASSLDGYIAMEDGDVSWLEGLGISIEDAGYDAFYSSVDALAMGRKTYEMIASFGLWPYADKPTWICSSGQVAPMDESNLQAGNTPEHVVRAAKAMGIEHLWLVGGGNLASTFIQRGLLSNIYLSLMPIVLGGGIKLFGTLPSPVKISKEQQTAHESGLIQIEYSIDYVSH